MQVSSCRELYFSLVHQAVGRRCWWELWLIPWNFIWSLLEARPSLARKFYYKSVAVIHSSKWVDIVQICEHDICCQNISACRWNVSLPSFLWLIIYYILNYGSINDLWQFLVVKCDDVQMDGSVSNLWLFNITLSVICKATLESQSISCVDCLLKHAVMHRAWYYWMRSMHYVPANAVHTTT